MFLLGAARCEPVRALDLFKQAVAREKAAASGEVTGVLVYFAAPNLGPDASARCLEEVDKFASRLDALPQDTPIPESAIDLNSTVFFPSGKRRFDYRYSGDKYRIAIDLNPEPDKSYSSWVNGVFHQLTPEQRAKVVSTTDEACDGSSDFSVEGAADRSARARTLTIQTAGRSHEPWQPGFFDPSLRISEWGPVASQMLHQDVRVEAQEISPGKYQVKLGNMIQYVLNAKTGLIEAETGKNPEGKIIEFRRWCRPVESEGGVWRPSVLVHALPGEKEAEINFILFQSWRFGPVADSEFNIPASAYDTVKHYPPPAARPPRQVGFLQRSWESVRRLFK